MVLHKTDPVG